VTIYHVGVAEFYEQLFRRTGNEEHVNKVLAKIKGNVALSSEEEIYKKRNTHM
jgi:hypothetical protein